LAAQSSEAVQEVIRMRAEVGDEIVVRGLVLWENGHDSVFMPSSDSLVEHHPPQATVG
jgi:hypothetical protein